MSLWINHCLPKFSGFEDVVDAMILADKYDMPKYQVYARFQAEQYFGNHSLFLASNTPICSTEEAKKRKSIIIQRRESSMILGVRKLLQATSLLLNWSKEYSAFEENIEKFIVSRLKHFTQHFRTLIKTSYGQVLILNVIDRVKYT